MGPIASNRHRRSYPVRDPALEPHESDVGSVSELVTDTSRRTTALLAPLPGVNRSSKDATTWRFARKAELRTSPSAPKRRVTPWATEQSRGPEAYPLGRCKSVI